MKGAAAIRESARAVFAIRERAESWLRRVLEIPDLRIGQRFTRFAGANHHNFMVELIGTSLPQGNRFLLRLPGQAVSYLNNPAESIRDSMVAEHQTLLQLGGRVGEFSVPTAVFFEERAPDFDGQPALLVTACPGMPMDSKIHFEHGQASCRLIGRAIAAIHALEPGKFTHLGGYESTNQHLESMFRRIPPRFLEREQWATQAAQMVDLALEEPDKTNRLIHGDVLPHNLIHPLANPEIPPAIIDWEFAGHGDPAYDFAILFRGNCKLFGLMNGRNLVLQAYREAGGRAISRRRIDAYEASLLLYWLSRGHPAEQLMRQQLANVCRRF